MELFVPGTSTIGDGIVDWEVSINKSKFSDEEKHAKVPGQRYKRKRTLNGSEEDEPNTRRKRYEGLISNEEALLLNGFRTSSPEGLIFLNKVLDFKNNFRYRKITSIT